jgi:glucose-1-phosphate thymidylyltransferase
VDDLPGYVGFFNGLGAGASIPTHFHFQFFQRPFKDEQFALEIADNKDISSKDEYPKLKDYPIAVVMFSGSRNKVVEEATTWVNKFSSKFPSTSCLSANIIASRVQGDGTDVNLYIAPRNNSRSYAPGMVGLVGGLEILGELVLSTEEEKQKLESGDWDYDSVCAVLSAVEPPGVREIIQEINGGAKISSSISAQTIPVSDSQAMVGILAVGGEGRRFEPNQYKHLEVVYDKPAIFYFLSQIMMAGIKEIMIVCSERNRYETERMVRKELFGKTGIEFKFCTAQKANGPAGVFRINLVRDFVYNRPVALMLDGIYFGGNFKKKVQECGMAKSGCMILARSVADPGPFGWIDMDIDTGEVFRLVEKPNIEPRVDMKYIVQTHMYFYGPDVIERADQISPSANGEFDVVSLHELYRQDGMLNVVHLDDTKKSTLNWDDAGTPEKRLDLEIRIRKYQEEHNELVGSPHLEGFYRKWVKRDHLLDYADQNRKSAYWQMVKMILES